MVHDEIESLEAVHPNNEDEWKAAQIMPWQVVV